MKCCLAQQDGYECNCEAIQRVRELHAYDPDAICTSCNYLHPCPTIKALDGDE